jgi:dolichyl-phosphate beta-glucosyltransferase
MPKIAIIIPCYNEGKRLCHEPFRNFLTGTPEADIFFVNDGSTDNTFTILEEIKSSLPGNNITILTLKQNKGKAYATREGILMASSQNQYNYIGYLDADLSTSLENLYALFLEMDQNKADYILGSRIKMLNALIKRNWFRHIAGRLIATVIDSKFKLGIYDTQCGAKCFASKLIAEICKEPFKTKWFFDVELLLRIKSACPLSKGIEYPLNKWIDPGGSKMNIFKFPAIIKELYLLFKNYSRG